MTGVPNSYRLHTFIIYCENSVPNKSIRYYMGHDIKSEISKCIFLHILTNYTRFKQELHKLPLNTKN